MLAGVLLVVKAFIVYHSVGELLSVCWCVGVLFDTHTTHLPHTMQSSKRIGANTKTRNMFMVGLKLIVACAALLTKSKQSSPDVA